MNKKEIAFCDIGVGGLTLLNEAMKLMPREDYIYYFDNMEVDNAILSHQDRVAWCLKAIDSLKGNDLKAIVFVWDGISNSCIAELNNMGNVPILGVLPLNKSSEHQFDPRKMLLLGSELGLSTSDVNEYIVNLDEGEEVDTLMMQDLCQYSAEFDFDSVGLRRYLQKSLGKISWDKYHSIVLGSSDFIYFKRQLEKVIPQHVNILDAQSITLQHLKESIVQNMYQQEVGLKCMLSGKEFSKEIIAPYLNYLESKDFFRATQR